MATRPIRGTRFVVTGASSGIGQALAEALAREGGRLLLNARREDKLTALAASLRPLGAEVETVPGDIAEPATRMAILDRAQAAFGGLDVLVNNAGIGALGRFEDADSERLRRVMEVNFFALVEMTRLALPLLRQGQRPMIVNISSILGHRAVPHSSEYCASKFAVQGFSESIRAELARLGINVLVVSPGTTQTEFFDNVIDRKGKTPWPEQAGVPAEYVARATVRAIRRGKHEIIPNPRGRLLVWLNRVNTWLADKLMERYG